MAPKYRDTAVLILEHARKHPGSSLADIGRSCNVSREWVRRVLRRAGLNQRARHTMRDWILCEHCRTYFRAPKSQVERGRKFCSRECAYAYRRLTHRAVRQCRVCGREFMVPRYYLRLGKGKVCSTRCRVIAMRRVALERHAG